VPLRGPLRRTFVVIALLAGAVVLFAGGIQLGAPGLVAVSVAGVLVGGTCAGMAREMPERGGRSVLECGVLAAATTVAGLLLVSGVDVLGGGAAAALVVVLGMTAAVTYAVRRQRRRGKGAAILGFPGAMSTMASSRPAGRSGPPALPPVTSLSTAALGREWILSTAALGVRLEPATRQSIVHRRQAALDELERRDPVGFARWLASGPRPGSDPAEYVRDHRPAADTDAA